MGVQNQLLLWNTRYPDAAEMILRKDAITDTRVNRMDITIIDQCHVRQNHEKFLPFTCNTHSPYGTKLRKPPQICSMVKPSELNFCTHKSIVV
jgi:hypothetical protein